MVPMSVHPAVPSSILEDLTHVKAHQSLRGIGIRHRSCGCCRRTRCCLCCCFSDGGKSSGSSGGPTGASPIPIMTDKMFVFSVLSEVEDISFPN
jgi:hypothetical protein